MSERVFFSSAGRSLDRQDRIELASVGVDIGSSTSHLVFSRIVMERLDSRYVPVARETLHRSEILLTPYEDADTIDAAALGAFIDEQYRVAGIDPAAIDSGALILTGVAVRRTNSRRIGALFARQAGRLVALSAGDALETTLAAYGAGAVAASIRAGATVINIDIGGGTTKIAVCADGRVVDQTALDVGARLVCLDAAGQVLRVEAAGRRFAAELGLAIEPGRRLEPGAGDALAAAMADRLMAALRGEAPTAGGAGLLRLEPLAWRGRPDRISLSGGVSDYLFGRETRNFGDLGSQLAAAVRSRLDGLDVPLAAAPDGIRATVVGAAQYSVQLSGSTIYVAPSGALPLRDLAVIAPDLGLDRDAIDPAAVAAAITAALKRLDLGDGERPVGLFVPWRGSASFARLDCLCRGVAAGLQPVLAHGWPLVLAGDGDVGGLIGLHCRETLGLTGPIVSIDGLELTDLDHIDIGAMLDGTGAVPVVIKSLLFP